MDFIRLDNENIKGINQNKDIIFNGNCFSNKRLIFICRFLIKFFPKTQQSNDQYKYILV